MLNDVKNESNVGFADIGFFGFNNNNIWKEKRKMNC